MQRCFTLLPSYLFFRFHFSPFSDTIFRYNKALAVPAEQNQVFRKWFDRNDSIDSNFIERINTQMFVPLLMSLLIVSLAEALLGSRLNCSGFESNFPKSFVKVFFFFFISIVSWCPDTRTLGRFWSCQVFNLYLILWPVGYPI